MARLETHGMTYTRFYKNWKSMKQRCLNINHRDRKNYGGRGIKICDEWLKFKNFYDDMYKSYLKHKNNNKYTSIERINVNGNYELGNCKWANFKEQNKNKRNIPDITYNGKTMKLFEWANELNINRSTLWERVYRCNWSIEKALTTKINKECRK